MLRGVALDTTAGSSDGPKWIQIACVGQWAGHPSGPFQLGPKQFAEMVANFKATKNQRIPIDFEHASEMDPREGTVPTLGAPAQGWMIDLDNRGAEGLFALVDWKEPARTYIREGKYLFFSPTIRFNPTDPKTGLRNGARLSSGALTNSPFLDGMQPLAASASLNPSTLKAATPVITLPDTQHRVERLVSAGHHPKQAQAIATAEAARAVAASLTAEASEVVQLADRVRAGEATIVQLADKIASDRHLDRNLAFGEAERMLRAR